MFATMRKDSPQYLDYHKLVELGFTFVRRQVQQKMYVQNIYALDINLFCHLIITIDYDLGILVKCSAYLQEVNYCPIKTTKITEADTVDQLIEDIIYVASK